MFPVDPRMASKLPIPFARILLGVEVEGQFLREWINVLGAKEGGGVLSLASSEASKVSIKLNWRVFMFNSMTCPGLLMQYRQFIGVVL